ncbi:hypothetical protein EYF80_001356 [Liparis tanakae]|uniref:Uncharacterized protein n=1 Tax=Liparis tanakae TaxID=230148 RepID=A0A4Z2JFI8_9TELE|nr:hypothetical protein EYF80_001356 [Liparis tanakae]
MQQVASSRSACHDKIILATPIKWRHLSSVIIWPEEQSTGRIPPTDPFSGREDGDRPSGSQEAEADDAASTLAGQEVEPVSLRLSLTP